MKKTTLFGIALIAGGMLLKAVARTPGCLVYYAARGADTGHFREVARRIAERFPLPRSIVIPAENGEDLLRSLLTGSWQGERLGTFELVAFVGHGSPSSFFGPGAWGLRAQVSSRPTWVSAQEHASALAPYLARQATVSFVGCRAGADPREADWVEMNYGPGGAQSLAALYRDALVRAGAPSGVEVRARAATGEAGGNPMGRMFPARLDQVGRPGRSLMQVVRGESAWRDPVLRQRWAGEVRGTPAFQWIAGKTVVLG